MSQITAQVPDKLLQALDTAAAELELNRAKIVRHALERYLEDFEDLTVSQERLRDPTDPVLDWDQVRHELIDPDLAQRSQRAGADSTTGSETHCPDHRLSGRAAVGREYAEERPARASPSACRRLPGRVRSPGRCACGLGSASRASTRSLSSAITSGLQVRAWRSSSMDRAL